MSEFINKTKDVLFAFLLQYAMLYAVTYNLYSYKEGSDSKVDDTDVDNGIAMRVANRESKQKNRKTEKQKNRKTEKHGNQSTPPDTV